MKVLCIFLCSVSVGTYAQFSSGSILRQNGERVHGYTKVESVNELYFKAESGENAQQQLPDEVLEVMVGGRCWRSISTTGNKREFAALRLKGKLSVYEIGYRVLIQKDSSEVFELKLVLDRNARENAKYRGILNALTSDCAGLSASSIGGSIDDVIAFAERYNTCKGSSSKRFSIETERTKKIDFSCWAGVTWADINTSNYFALSNIAFAKSSSFTVGGRLGLDMSRSQNTRAVFDVSYLQANYAAPADFVDIRSSLLRASVGLQQKFNLIGFRPYVLGGFAVHFPLDFTVKVTSITPPLVYEETKNGNIGAWAGVGVAKQIQRSVAVFAEVRGEASSGYGARGGPNRLGSLPTYFSVVFGISLQ